MLQLVALSAALAAPVARASSRDGSAREGPPAPRLPASQSDALPLFPAGYKPPQAGGAAKPAPRAPDTGGVGALTTTAIPLGVVLGLIVIAAFIFKRAVRGGSSLAAAIGAGGRAPAGLLEVLGRYPVARGQTLVLLKLDQRVLLLSQCQPTRGNPGGFTTLSEITDPVDVASILTKVSETESTGPAARFNAMLADAHADHEPARRARGIRRLAEMINPQPVSWQEPEPPAPTQPEFPETPAPTMRFTGVDSLRSRLAAMKGGAS